MDLSPAFPDLDDREAPEGWPLCDASCEMRLVHNGIAVEWLQCDRPAGHPVTPPPDAITPASPEQLRLMHHDPRIKVCWVHQDRTWWVCPALARKA